MFWARNWAFGVASQGQDLSRILWRQSDTRNRKKRLSGGAHITQRTAQQTPQRRGEREAWRDTLERLPPPPPTPGRLRRHSGPRPGLGGDLSGDSRDSFFTLETRFSLSKHSFFTLWRLFFHSRPPGLPDPVTSRHSGSGPLGEGDSRGDSAPTLRRQASCRSEGPEDPQKGPMPARFSAGCTSGCGLGGCSVGRQAMLQRFVAAA